MELSQPNGIQFIEGFEGLRLVAYKDQHGIWTIGWGSIMYQSGVAVKEGDTITPDQAEVLLLWEIGIKTVAVNSYIQTVSLNQNQFDSLISFAYNCGCAALHGSTLLRLILAVPDNPYITNAFQKWDKVNEDGELVKSNGLWTRRTAEAKLYFTPIP